VLQHSVSARWRCSDSPLRTKVLLKGIWDGAGMVIKAFIRDSEVSLAQRFPDALACFIHGKDALKVPKGRKDWEKLEAELDPKILDKATFTSSKRFFGFVTDDKEQYDELRNVHEHIVFTDREKVPSIPRIKGTHKLHSEWAILLLGSYPPTVQQPSSSPLEHFLANALYAGKSSLTESVASNTLQKNKCLQ
jgi:hypothetical protein